MVVSWSALSEKLSTTWRGAHESQAIADAAWKHFEPLLLAHGYSIIWTPELDLELPVNLSEMYAGLTKHGADHLPAPVEPFWPQQNEAFNEAAFSRSDHIWTGRTGRAPVLRAAYDHAERMVILKALVSSSSELEIMRYLVSPELRLDRRNRTIPVLQVIPTEEWTIIVMPCWSAGPCQGPPYSEPLGYLQAAEQMLQGLSFMHELGIAHMDVHEDNIVLNHFTDDWPIGIVTTYIPFLSKFNAQFAYIDFEYSQRFSDTREVAEMAFPISYHRVPEIGWVDWVYWPSQDPRAPLQRAGVLHDPFAADIWMLGRVFREQLEQHERWARLHCTVPAADSRPTTKLRCDVPGYLDLIGTMMHEDPRARPSVVQALDALLQLERQVRRTATGETRAG